MTSATAGFEHGVGMANAPSMGQQFSGGLARPFQYCPERTLSDSAARARHPGRQLGNNHLIALISMPKLTDNTSGRRGRRNCKPCVARCRAAGRVKADQTGWKGPNPIAALLSSAPRGWRPISFPAYTERDPLPEEQPWARESPLGPSAGPASQAGGPAVRTHVPTTGRQGIIMSLDSRDVRQCAP